MRERFSERRDAGVWIDGTPLPGVVTYRSEGIAPGDCRQYCTAAEYDAIESFCRPQVEQIVYEVTVELDDVPAFIDALDETGDECTVTFDCDGHYVDGVTGTVHDVTDGTVTVAGVYETPIDGG